MEARKVDEKITLRTSDEKDAEEFHLLMKRNLERFRISFTKSINAASSVDEAANYIAFLAAEKEAKRIFHFFIQSEEKIVGMVFIKEIEWRVPKCELAYFIAEDHEGKGIMKRAIHATTNFCFDELGMNKIFIRTALSNPKSSFVAQACGFEKEGVLRCDFRSGTGELQDVNYFGLVKK
jgi:ribosomal-protein-serine acetyltransferase